MPEEQQQTPQEVDATVAAQADDTGATVVGAVAADEATAQNIKEAAAQAS